MSIKLLSGFLFWSFVGIGSGAIFYKFVVAPIGGILRWTF